MSRKRKFTDDIFYEIISKNSKENPFNIDNYDKQSIVNWRLLKNNRCSRFFVEFTCKMCGKLTIKLCNKKYNKDINKLIYCQECNCKLSKLERYGSQGYNNVELRKNVFLEKYGVDNPAKSEIVKKENKKNK